MLQSQAMAYKNPYEQKEHEAVQVNGDNRGESAEVIGQGNRRLKNQG